MTESFSTRASTPTADIDVCIVGAGAAGASLAYVLGKAGVRTALVDSRTECAPSFKAEKVEPDQVELFRELGLMHVVEPVAHRIEKVVTARGRRFVGVAHPEQYGVHYHDLVNALRGAAAEVSDFVHGRVNDIQTSDSRQRVTLSDGRAIDCRLVVMSAGATSGKLHQQLGFAKTMISPRHSMAYGFDIEPVGRAHFDFESITYMPSRLDQVVDYVTIFPLPDCVRVNMFMYHAPDDPGVRGLLTDARAELQRMVPGLFQLTGDFRISSKVESFPIDLYVASSVERAGIVLIGDSFQSVCPATGTGLSKVLTDVAVLAKSYIPRWFGGEGVSAESVAGFYRNERKRNTDAYSLASAGTHRSIATKYSLRYRVHRTKLYTLRAISDLLRFARVGGSAS